MVPMRRTTHYVALISMTVASMIVWSILSYGPPALGQAEAPKIGFFGSYKVTADKMDPSKLPIIGAWRMNFEKSDPSMKAAGRFKPTATTIDAAESGGIRHSIFNSYPPAVNNYQTVFTLEARTYWAKLDGKGIYENPQGPNGKGETAGLWLVDRNTIFRERWVKGAVDERTLYRVSPDGNTLVWTNFPASGDSTHVVWDRIRLP
jgi:hypothetical protein